MKIKVDVLDLLRTPQARLDAAFRKGALTFAIIGAGHIGLPLAIRLAETGAKVYGVTKTRLEANNINNGQPLFYEPGLTTRLREAIRKDRLHALTDTSEATRRADIVFICVGTPVDNRRRPDLRAIRDVCRKVGRALTKGKLVILRSTVPPGFTGKVAKAILESNSKLTAGEDFGLAFCPERLVQGRALQEMVSVPQIVGGVNKETRESTARVFRALGCPVVSVENTTVAEMAKLFDNVYRDVNIALANELALICEASGIDVMQVIQASNNGPRTRVLTPGSGTGGSCLNKDPYILLHYAHEAGVRPRIVPVARKLNENMPHLTVKRVEQALEEAGKPIKGARIAILGLSFKRDTDDLRDTVAKPIIKGLRALGATIVAYDPLASPAEVRHHLGPLQLANSLTEAALKSDCLLILTDHQEFKKMDFQLISKRVNRPVAIVDGRQVVNPGDAVQNGFLFSGIGRPTIPPRMT